MTSRPLKLGVSACFFHPDPARPLFKGKTLLYLEQSMAHWLQSHGALVFLLPTLCPKSPSKLTDLVREIDGLVLQGGTDVSPENYGESPLKPEWRGDPVRDHYEMVLIQEAMTQKKPILGICRGCQLINVAMGGSLYQDIETQVTQAKNHRNWDLYDQNFHNVAFTSNSWLASLYPQVKSARVNSIHHQAVKKLGSNLTAEAVSEDDGVIEAIRYTGENFVFGFQWHPEFMHADASRSVLLDCAPILEKFLLAARKR